LTFRKALRLEGVISIEQVLQFIDEDSKYMDSWESIYFNDVVKVKLGRWETFDEGYADLTPILPAGRNPPREIDVSESVVIKGKFKLGGLVSAKKVCYFWWALTRSTRLWYQNQVETLDNQVSSKAHDSGRYRGSPQALFPRLHTSASLP